MPMLLPQPLLECPSAMSSSPHPLGMSDGIGCKETPPLETHPSLYLLFIGANTSLWEENK